MAIYVILVLLIFLGNILVSYHIISKKLYCICVCCMLVALSGFRNIDVGMYDTKTVYLPSFDIICQNSFDDLNNFPDTHFKFLGYVLYAKLISLIACNQQFFIFMTSFPFFVATTHLIYKYSEIPFFSFILLLTMGYLSYSFSSIRGMLALSVLAISFDCAIQNKWKLFFVFVFISASFHLTSVIFIIVYFLKDISWNRKYLFFYIILSVLALLYFKNAWIFFVHECISHWLPTYNYYDYKGGEFALGMFIVYVFSLIIPIIKILISNAHGLYIERNNIINKNNYIDTYFNSNKNIIELFIGMSFASTLMLCFTFFLSEFIRVAMLFGLANILLVGQKIYNEKRVNKIFFYVIRVIQLGIFIAYLFFCTLPNMKSIPYSFFVELS